MWAALKHGEDSEIDGVHVLLSSENDSLSWATQTLVSGRCDDVAGREWAGEQSRGDEAAGMSDIGQEEGTN